MRIEFSKKPNVLLAGIEACIDIVFGLFEFIPTLAERLYKCGWGVRDVDGFSDNLEDFLLRYVTHIKAPDTYNRKNFCQFAAQVARVFSGKIVMENAKAVVANNCIPSYAALDQDGNAYIEIADWFETTLTESLAFGYRVVEDPVHLAFASVALINGRATNFYVTPNVHRLVKVLKRIVIMRHQGRAAIGLHSVERFCLENNPGDWNRTIANMASAERYVRPGFEMPMINLPELI